MFINNYKNFFAFNIGNFVKLYKYIYFYNISFTKKVKLYIIIILHLFMLDDKDVENPLLEK